MLDAIIFELQRFWNWIKKIIISVLSFLGNISSFFRNPRRLMKIKSDKDIVAAVIKQKMEAGDYNVANVLFNKKTGELVDPEEDALIIKADSLDRETTRRFGDKDLLVLE